MPGEFLPLDRKAWLLAIGRRLRAEYDAVAEPVPERLDTLIRQLERSAAVGAVRSRNGKPGAD